MKWSIAIEDRLATLQQISVGLVEYWSSLIFWDRIRMMHIYIAYLRQRHSRDYLMQKGIWEGTVAENITLELQRAQTLPGW
jgi:hypothetical protein